jgi:hypothetical protein
MRHGRFPGICPDCRSTDVSMRSALISTHPTGRPLSHGPDGSARTRATRMGDPGTENDRTESECHACGVKWIYEKPKWPQVYCGYCFEEFNSYGRNHCPFCAQPNYDELYGHRERRQQSEAAWRRFVGLDNGPRFFEPSFVNLRIQGAPGRGLMPVPIDINFTINPNWKKP